MVQIHPPRNQILSISCSLSVQVAERAGYRVNHVGTKLNEQEVRDLNTLAKQRNRTQGELIRRLIPDELARDSVENHEPRADRNYRAPTDVLEPSRTRGDRSKVNAGNLPRNYRRGEKAQAGLGG